MNCTVSSHNICCVCRLTIEGGSYVVTSEDRDLFLLKKNVFIPEGARYCSNHLVNGQLSLVAIDMISPSTIQYKKLSSNDVQLLINRLQIIFEKQKRLDFDNMESLSDDECKTFSSGETYFIVLIDINKRKQGGFNDLIVEPPVNKAPQGQ
ncbi:unnamed protein product [Rotaria sp. Silwood1]|nr:unnamed protein product [Rotaria sp. Silwood1]